jgi:hypothetical protein
MEMFALICGVLGIALSSLGILGFTVREHRAEKRRTLSELAAKDKKTLKEFRIILWTCGSLISVMVYLLIVPNISNGQWLALFYTVVIMSELTLAVVPARDNKLGKIHDALAYAMGTGMLLLALAFSLTLPGVFAFIEYMLLFGMLIMCGLALKYWHYFLYFELPFIFISHLTILVAALAVW